MTRGCVGTGTSTKRPGENGKTGIDAHTSPHFSPAVYSIAVPDAMLPQQPLPALL